MLLRRRLHAGFLLNCGVRLEICVRRWLAAFAAAQKIRYPQIQKDLWNKYRKMYFPAAF